MVGLGERIKRGIFITSIAVATIWTSAEASRRRDVFREPERLSGATLSIPGYLIFDVENKNLYPTRNWHKDWMKKRCLPIGVLNSDEKMTKSLRDMSGRMVIVHGQIRVLVAQGDLNDSLCKDVGLMIDGVRPM